MNLKLLGRSLLLSLLLTLFTATASAEDLLSRSSISRLLPADTMIFVHSTDTSAAIRKAEQLANDELLSGKELSSKRDRRVFRIDEGSSFVSPIDAIIESLSERNSSFAKSLTEVREELKQTTAGEEGKVSRSQKVLGQLARLFDDEAFFAYRFQKGGHELMFGFNYDPEQFDWWSELSSHELAEVDEKLTKRLSHRILRLPVEEVLLLKLDEAIIGITESQSEWPEQYFRQIIARQADRGFAPLAERREYQRIVSFANEEDNSPDIFYYQFHERNLRSIAAHEFNRRQEARAEVKTQQREESEQGRKQVEPLDERPRKRLGTDVDLEDWFNFSSQSTSCSLLIRFDSTDNSMRIRFIHPLTYPLAPLFAKQVEYLQPLDVEKKRLIPAGTLSASYYSINPIAKVLKHPGSESLAGSRVHASWSYDRLSNAESPRSLSSPYSQMLSPYFLRHHFDDREISNIYLDVKPSDKGRRRRTLQPSILFVSEIHSDESVATPWARQSGSEEIVPKPAQLSRQQLGGFSGWDYFDHIRGDLWNVNQREEAQILVGDYENGLVFLPYCSPTIDATHDQVSKLALAQAPTYFRIDREFGYDLEDFGVLLAVSYDRRSYELEAFIPAVFGIAALSKFGLDSSVGNSRWLDPWQKRPLNSLLGELASLACAQVWGVTNSPQLRSSGSLMATFFDEGERVIEIHALVPSNIKNETLNLAR